jgi:hypothetical protein
LTPFTDIKSLGNPGLGTSLIRPFFPPPAQRHAGVGAFGELAGAVRGALCYPIIVAYNFPVVKKNFRCAAGAALRRQVSNAFNIWPLTGYELRRVFSMARASGAFGMGLGMTFSN